MDRAAHRYARPGVKTSNTRSAPAKSARLGNRRMKASGTAPSLVARPSGGSNVIPVLGTHRSRTYLGTSYGSGYGSYGNYGLGLYLGLSFGLGYGYGYGCYSYPYYYGSFWPYYYHNYCYSYPSWYHYYNYGHHYGYGFSYSWWYGTPTYIPVSYYSSYIDGYDDSDLVDDSPGTEIIVVAGGSDAGAPESLIDLANRYVALGDYYFKEGRFADAADAYARARTYAPDDATIHFVLADALFAVGDYHFAAFLIAEALRLDPTIARADADKRTFYGDVKLFETQMATLAGYLEEKPYDAAAHLVYGYNLLFSGRKAESKSAFKRVLEIEAGHKAARTFLDALEELLPAKVIR